MSFVVPAPYATSAALNKLKNANFIAKLLRLTKQDDILFSCHLKMQDGQSRPNVIDIGPLQVAISDTYINTTTRKRSTTKRTPGLITIEMIQVAPDKRGKGHAAHMMKGLCQLADQMDVYLRLQPLATHESPIQDAELTAWYARLGFTTPDGLFWVREPHKR